jgi:hydrogenase 3 maturation protease
MPKNNNISQQLHDWLIDAKKVVIAGIGNPIRRDDFVGTKIAQDLQGKVSKNVLLIECETVPESYLLDIERFKPTHVLLIDAAILNLAPGEGSLVLPQDVAGFSAVTSHVLPLRVFSDYLKESTGAKVALLLIQPKTVEFGEGLSPELCAASVKIADLLLRLLAKI